MALGEGNEFGVRYNGGVVDGTWVERDIEFIRIGVVGGSGTAFRKKDKPYPEDTTGSGNGKFIFEVTGWTGKILEVMQTRGTIIGFELGGGADSTLVDGTGLLPVTLAGTAPTPSHVSSDYISVMLGTSSGAFRDASGAALVSAPGNLIDEIETAMEEAADGQPDGTITVEVCEFTVRDIVPNPPATVPV